MRFELLSDELQLLERGVAACLILEHLYAELPDARVDHRCADGINHFVIRNRGFRYEVNLPEPMMETLSFDDLAHVLDLVVQRVLASGGPRRIRVGSSAAGGAEAT
jgi:hypothetical protein